MTNVLSPGAKQQFFDNNGRPLVGGKLFTYEAGTTTKLSTYTDSGGMSTNTNPVILDYRGECNLWIPPNVPYKYVLAPSTDTDPPTNPIWSVDDVVSSQLITLYGGLDTGSADAYILTFTANFTVYADGIVIYWIPANTNTGASTLNVNGLGPIDIVNQNGDALTASQIIAGQVITVMYLNGDFLLISSGIAASVSTGTFTPSWSGFSADPTGDMAWQVTGRMATLEWLGTTGTSDANFMTIDNLPSNLRPTTRSLVGMSAAVMIDNGANKLGSVGHAALGTVQFNLGTTPSGTGFTTSGPKGLDTGWTWTYLLN
jgi:hypothetical protein